MKNIKKSEAKFIKAFFDLEIEERSKTTDTNKKVLQNASTTIVRTSNNTELKYVITISKGSNHE